MTTSTVEAAEAGMPPLSLLEKAAKVLSAFESAGPRLTLTEVVQRSGIRRSSAHRILDQLVQLRWLEREGRDYRLGMGMLELGAMASHHNRLRRTALPHLHALHESTGHLVHLTVLDGSEVVYLERIGGSDDSAVPSRAGGRQPAYCTASGKAILAFSDAPLVERVLRDGLRPRTPRTITRPETFRHELAVTRERGVAFDHEEGYRGVFCVAAPLRGSGRAVAAISVCGHGVHREMARLAPAVRGCARSVWQSLFGPGRRPEQRVQAAGAGLVPGTPQPSMDDMMTWLRFSDWM
ncbi:IclR family transcriptional regulator [Streptomyces showdoensis]|uniref:IclR family transcriptional regulator n=1 Tax=Streptomyces showdoensis TaxID=68268 RepID=A0A2P2GQE2_STREW|nr:IclR family transcriptional regulator [Streptomyces showdoensis]KKZ73720.1 IclR family transcriptional regulator [Streptomyces showdoensis]